MVLAERLQIPLRDTAGTRAHRRSDDGDTFAELVQRYDHTVHNVIRSMVHNPQDVEDVSQEVWIKVANNLANLRDQSRFLPWLYRISRNCALSFLSTQKNRQQVANTDEDDLVAELASPLADGPEAQAISVAERREVWAALAALSDADRTVLLLREFHELPYADIARELNISRGNAEVRVFRARSRFRQQFVRREGAMARGFLGMPLFGLLGKLRLLWGASSVVSTSASGSVAAGVTAAGATTGAGVAAEVGVGIVAKLVIAAAALSVAASAVSTTAPGVAPSLGGSEDRASASTAPVAAATSADIAVSSPPASATAALEPGLSLPSSTGVGLVPTKSGQGASASTGVPAARLPEVAAPVLVAIVVPVTASVTGLPSVQAFVPAFALPVTSLVSAALVGTSSAAAALGTNGQADGDGIGSNAAGSGGSAEHGNRDQTPAADRGNTGGNSNAGGQAGHDGQDKASPSDHGNAGMNAPAATTVGNGGQDKASPSDRGNGSANSASVSTPGKSGQDKALAAEHANSSEQPSHGHAGH